MIFLPRRSLLFALLLFLAGTSFAHGGRNRGALVSGHIMGGGGCGLAAMAGLDRWSDLPPPSLCRGIPMVRRCSCIGDPYPHGDDVRASAAADLGILAEEPGEEWVPSAASGLDFRALPDGGIDDDWAGILNVL